MNPLYHIQNRFINLHTRKKDGLDSLIEICKNNNYDYNINYSKIQLIHIILNKEYSQFYNEFINFIDVDSSDIREKFLELKKMNIHELKNRLKNYNLTTNGVKKHLIDRIIKYEFYNKIIYLKEQQNITSYLNNNNLDYEPLLNYINKNYSNQYNIETIYQPYEFYNIYEYIKHMENLKKLNRYDLINRNLSVLSEQWYRFVEYNLIDIGWNFNIDYDSVIEETVNMKYCEKKENSNIIDNIKEFTFKSNNTELENCRICMDDIKKGDICKELCKGHIFHSNCINNWLKRSLECPICRNTIT